jgi:hypothetical protein
MTVAIEFEDGELRSGICGSHIDKSGGDSCRNARNDRSCSSHGVAPAARRDAALLSLEERTGGIQTIHTTNRLKVKNLSSAELLRFWDFVLHSEF